MQIQMQIQHGPAAEMDSRPNESRKKSARPSLIRFHCAPFVLIFVLVLIIVIVIVLIIVLVLVLTTGYSLVPCAFGIIMSSLPGTQGAMHWELASRVQPAPPVKDDDATRPIAVPATTRSAMAVPAATAPLFFPSRRECVGVGIDIDNGDDSDADGFVMVSVDGFVLFCLV